LSALEASSLGREEDIAEVLCHHAIKAQDWGKAHRYGHLAAKKAQARSAFRDATGFFQIAMDAVEKQPASTAREQRAIDLRIEARMAFSPFGKTAEWLELCRDAEARSEKIGDERRRLASISVRAAALNFYGTPYEAITVGEQAVALAQRLADAAWLGFAEYGLGQAYFLAGRYGDAELILNQASTRFANAPGNAPPGTTGSSLLVLCHMMKAIVHASMGEFDQSEESSRQASNLAEASGLSYDMIAADYGRGLSQLVLGNLDGAESALDEASLLSRENEVRLFLPVVLCGLGSLYLQRARPAEAKAILLEAKDEAEALGHSSSILLASTHLASAYAQLGDFSGGLEMARACQAGAKQKGYQGIEALALLAEAGILSLQGAAAEAIAQLERTVEIAARLGTKPLLARAKGTLARLLVVTGRRSEARDELGQAIELFAQSKMTIQLERAKAAFSRFSSL
jgi:tetratricopeptide (TPR) repeat protein